MTLCYSTLLSYHRISKVSSANFSVGLCHFLSNLVRSPCIARGKEDFFSLPQGKNIVTIPLSIWYNISKIQPRRHPLGEKGKTMKFFGLEKLSLVDYDDHTSATVFTGGCNFYCPFCHNGGLVDIADTRYLYDEEDILSYLKKRKNLLDGLAITGGEPTLHKSLPDFIKKVKDIGYEVKLDTNGTNPTMLLSLVENNLVDYVAMDIKNSPAKYSLTIGKSTYDLTSVNESINILLSKGKKYEFRTTVMAELHAEEDFVAIADWIEGADNYVIQAYRDTDQCLSHGFTQIKEETAKKYLDIVAKKVKNAKLRGY